MLLPELGLSLFSPPLEPWFSGPLPSSLVPRPVPVSHVGAGAPGVHLPLSFLLLFPRALLPSPPFCPSLADAITCPSWERGFGPFLLFPPFFFCFPMGRAPFFSVAPALMLLFFFRTVVKRRWLLLRLGLKVPGRFIPRFPYVSPSGL